MTTLDEFDESFAQETVAFAYEVAKFSLSNDPAYSDRKITDWSRYVQREKPVEEDWQQDEDIEHRIRDVTPLVRGSDDASSEEAEAFEYSYTSYDGEVREKLGVDDPRGSESVVRCTPLVPAEDSTNSS